MRIIVNIDLVKVFISDCLMLLSFSCDFKVAYAVVIL